MNDLGQPIGPALSGWKSPPLPPREPMEGRYCRVELLDAARHAVDLHAANSLDKEGRNWTYLSIGPFEKEAEYRAWVEKVAAAADPIFHAIVDAATRKAVGVAAYMRMEVTYGVVEVG